MHESYLRFLQNEGLSFDDRRRFLAYPSQVMRSVVVDFVRQRQSERRGGEHVAVTLNSAIADVVAQPEAEVPGEPVAD